MTAASDRRAARLAFRSAGVLNADFLRLTAVLPGLWALRRSSFVRGLRTQHRYRAANIAVVPSVSIEVAGQRDTVLYRCQAADCAQPPRLMTASHGEAGRTSTEPAWANGAR